MKIFCCSCKKEVDARLTNGEEIYPHRTVFFDLPFWICDTCKNYIGCHHKTENPLTPLGVISTPEIKKERIKIHYILDPLWKSGKVNRKKIYAKLSSRLGYQYHTANIRSIEEAKKVIKLAEDLVCELEGLNE